jgi:hypothetical protein
MDLTAFTPALKALYNNQKVENLTYQNRPLWAMLRKNKDFYGKNKPLPIIIGGPQRRSATFATAQAQTSSSVLRDFVLVRKKDYSFATVDHETMEASENDKGAFLKALTVEVDGAMNSAANSACTDLFGAGSGVIGRLAAATDVTTAVGILADADDIVHFEVGMVLKSTTAFTGGALKAGSITVASVDRDAGTFTASAALDAGIATIADTDYLVPDGDYDLKAKGLAAWLPATAPTAGDNFFGVDRSVDPTRLAGVRFDGTALSAEEALIKCASRLYREGSSFDKVFLGTTKYSELEISLGSKVQYVNGESHKRPDIGFQGIRLNVKNRFVDVFCDPWCPNNRGYMLQMNTWAVESLKEPIRVLAQDGNRMLRTGTEDSSEVRIGGYKQFGCNAPGWNAVILF